MSSMPRAAWVLTHRPSETAALRLLDDLDNGHPSVPTYLINQIRSGVTSTAVERDPQQRADVRRCAMIALARAHIIRHHDDDVDGDTPPPALAVWLAPHAGEHLQGCWTSLLRLVCTADAAHAVGRQCEAHITTEIRTIAGWMTRGEGEG